jgi:hypothetical protein
MWKPVSIIVTLLLVTTALAQGSVISPLAIVINPRPAFDVEVWVDRDEARAEAPVYEVGEEIRFGVRVSEDAYVYLFNLRSDGQIQQILPNRFDAEGHDNFLRAGETRTFPPEGARYAFQVEPPHGLERVIAVASHRELPTQDLVAFERDAGFATGRMDEDQFARALSVVVEPVPHREWVTDTALFYVGERPARPEFGTLRIESTPPDAATYVDGQFVGYTPTDFHARPGEHVVRVEHPEYRDFETTATVRGGETHQLRATLREPVRRGALMVTGNVGGARVFLDDEQVGHLADVTGELRVDDVRPGRYRLRVTAPDFEDVDETVTVRADETSFVEVRLERTERAPQADDPIFRHVQLEPYPGAPVQRSRQEPDSLHMRFETTDALDDVYEHFHAQLRDWDRVMLDVRPNRVEAEYRRAGARLELSLRRLGASGVYDLEVVVIE